MVDVAQLVRVTDCGSEGRGFESHLPPKEQTKQKGVENSTPFVFIVYGANLFADIDYENKVVDCQLFAQCSSLEEPPRRAGGKDERSAVNPIYPLSKHNNVYNKALLSSALSEKWSFTLSKLRFIRLRVAPK